MGAVAQRKIVGPVVQDKAAFRPRLIVTGAVPAGHILRVRCDRDRHGFSGI